MDFNLLLSFAEVKAKIVPIIIAVLFFGLIILIHEFGHFIFAKLFGVKVNEFAIGMGPTLLKKQGKETKYALRAFPIGGFVSMEGEGEESDDKRAFCNQKVWKRMIIISAGAVFNLILGLIICIVLVSGEDQLASEKISGFYDGSVSSSQLLPDDEILKIDGKNVFSSYDVGFLMQRKNTGKYDFVVERNGEKIELNGVTFAKTTSGNFSYKDCVISSVSSKLKKAKTGYGRLYDGDTILSVNGVEIKNDEELIKAIRSDEDFVYSMIVKRHTGEVEEVDNIVLNTATILDFYVYPEDKTVGNILSNSFGYALSLGRMVYLSLFDLIRGQYGLNDLSGPIGTISVITDIAQESIVQTDYTTLFMLLAMITINIGIFNLLPVPALDGGHLFFMFFELIFRKKIPAKYESYIHAAGLVLLLIFMAVISASDIWKWISGTGFY